MLNVLKFPTTAMFAFYVIAGLRTPALSLTLPNGTTKTCTVISGGRPLVVREESDPRDTGLIGSTNWPAGGGGDYRITYYQGTMLRLYPLMDEAARQISGGAPGPQTNARTLVMLFAAYHECAHARLQSGDEFKVNCEALIQMRHFAVQAGSLTEGVLANWHYDLGATNSGVDGATYWQRTVECANRYPQPAAGWDTGWAKTF